MSTISCLPKQFIKKSYYLQRLGINSIAWNYHDVMQVIDYVAQHGCIILGGDVYHIIDDTVESTYDSWYTNKTSLTH